MFIIHSCKVQMHSRLKGTLLTLATIIIVHWKANCIIPFTTICFYALCDMLANQEPIGGYIMLHQMQLSFCWDIENGCSMCCTAQVTAISFQSYNLAQGFARVQQWK